MKYTVVLSRQAEHFYNRLEKKAREQVRACLLMLEDDTHSGKRLHGDLKDYWSLRVGKLRVIYTIMERDRTISIIAIGPRKTVYH